MLVKLREKSFLFAELFRAFNKLDYVSSWMEGWKAARAWDAGDSGKKRTSTSSPLQGVEDRNPPGECGLASSPSPCPPSGCSLQWGELRPSATHSTGTPWNEAG